MSEKVSNAIHATICCEILLAALQIMCNAAETFFTVDMKILRKKQDQHGKKEIFSRSVSRVTQGFAAGLVPAVESPAAVGRALCLLL